MSELGDDLPAPEPSVGWDEAGDDKRLALVIEWFLCHFGGAYAQLPPLQQSQIKDELLSIFRIRGIDVRNLPPLPPD